jgi:hypothetical protein
MKTTANNSHQLHRLTRKEDAFAQEQASVSVNVQWQDEATQQLPK